LSDIERLALAVGLVDALLTVTPATKQKEHKNLSSVVNSIQFKLIPSNIIRDRVRKTSIDSEIQTDSFTVSLFFKTVRVMTQQQHMTIFWK
jgi:hypothetical protein